MRGFTLFILEVRGKKVKVTIVMNGNKLVNLIENKLFCTFEFLPL